MAENPLLPVEEAERLNDSGLRENFILRVMAYHEWKKEVEQSADKQKIPYEKALSEEALMVFEKYSVKY